MNVIIFKFLFSLSLNPIVAYLSLFLSNIFIYILIVFAIMAPFLLNRHLIYSIIVFYTGVVSWVFVYLIKNIFMIPRPFITLHLVPLFMETGFSFPSSHVTVISALSVLIWKMNRKLGVIFLIFIILIGLSRIIIGVHYPIDVIAGMCFGMLIGFSVLWFYKVTNKFAFLRKYI